MRIHLIAIGGSAMHNFALALAHSGHDVTGSDDQIFEPSRSRLEEAGLLPSKEGWRPELLSSEIDVVILGMHARKDNPELARAKELGLDVKSYPEFLYHATQNKLRVVIGGSHGKTTITSMVLHVVKKLGRSADFMVGAQLEGFDRMLELNDANELAIIEGDEYLSSPIDSRSKFLHYKPNIAIITGISWDHINVFPTEESYLDTFRKFISTIEPNGSLVYCDEDPQIVSLISNLSLSRSDIKLIPYSTPKSINKGHGSKITYSDGSTSLTNLVGAHNFQNLAGARAICQAISISPSEFDKAIDGFTGAARRLEIVSEREDFVIFRDFAHAPSKLKATQAGVVGSFPDRKVTAIFELHTFSSLNKEFLPQYKNSMNDVDSAIVFYDPEVVKHKRLPAISKQDVKEAFARTDIEVITSVKELEKRFKEIPTINHCILLMSSGQFGGAIF
ncbi:MAG: peptidoglycan synthetase [Bacteroidetes bacterium]|nr:MAG: peptidoglycan synthetase [Bacteroidota bacterium]